VIDQPAGESLGQRLFSVLATLLFVPEGLPRREPSYWQASALAGLLFVVTRAIVIGIFAVRHFDLLTADPGDYLDLADFLAHHGHLSTGTDSANSHFPGLSILIALLSFVTRNSAVAGFLVSWSASIGSILLFHALFRNFRSTLLYVMFVPAWVAPSALIMTEGLTFLLMLTAIWAVNREKRFSSRLILLFLSGFVVVVRNTSLFFLVPFLAVWWWQQERKNGLRLLAYAAATSALPLAYVCWNLSTVGVVFPQLPAQEAYFASTVGEGYPGQLLTWPGLSLIHGFALGGVSIFKKLSVGLSLLVCVGVGIRYWRYSNSVPPRELAPPFAASTFAHLIFHLCIGGEFGFSSFDRYIADVNPVLVNGIAGQRRIRWLWLLLATVVGVLFAGLSGHTSDSIALVPYLKNE
jgi:hypothetical protein